MTSGSFTVTIDAKPEVVWPWVADLSKHADWSPKPYRIEWLEGEPNAVGLIKAASGQVGILSLELIPNAVHVGENDVVTTAGFKTDRLASYYPAGIPIGRVSSVSGNDTTGDTKVIQVTPFADFRHITDVLVLEPKR